jgi:predicted transcriptional regulator
MKLPTIEVSSTDSVAKLVTTMMQSHAFSALITENGNPLGVISDKEILRDIVESRIDPVKTTVDHLHYTPIVVLSESESVTNALKTIRKKGAARIAVVKNGQLIGMLMEKDIVATPQPLPKKR